MRNSSYNTTRRVNETWNKNEVVIIEYHRIKTKKLGHSQMWIEKTKKENTSGVNCCTKNCCHATSRV
jgi:hypothetical protein